jgi:hypothetical protein
MRQVQNEILVNDMSVIPSENGTAMHDCFTRVLYPLRLFSVQQLLAWPYNEKALLFCQTCESDIHKQRGQSW